LLIPTLKGIKEVTDKVGEVCTIKQSYTVTAAAEKMKEHKIGSLVVLDNDGEFVGTLTERDMLNKVLASGNRPSELLVREVMTANTIYCDFDAKISEAEELMYKNNIRHLPVVKDGKPISMISSRDVIAYWLRHNEAMRDAAEQLTMISTHLKSLNFDDVVDLAVNEIPKDFKAEQTVFCLNSTKTGSSTLYRNGCPLSEGELLDEKQFEDVSDTPKIFKECGKTCKAAGCNGPRLVIPLEIRNQCSTDDDKQVSDKGYLCMCGFGQRFLEKSELYLYKASLVQEVLNINLTNAKLYQNYQQARRDSEIDPLTGVGTRRVLKKALDAECERSSRYGRPFCLGIIDVDNFKVINDSIGHSAGDAALRQIAYLMRENIRKTDVIITRYGGDEFVLLMPETKLDGGKILMERLRKCVKSISIHGLKSLSISCGLAEWDNEVDDSPKSILNRADSALYAAKEKGRDRVSCNRPMIHAE